MKKLLSLIGLLSLMGCGYDQFAEFAGTDPNVPVPTTTIGELNELCSDKALIINRQYVIQGNVTSSDMEGNFFKSFVIQDKSGAIEIMAGLYNLHNIYPVGQHVVVETFGLTIASKNSVVQLGTQSKSAGGNGVEYFGYRTEIDRYVVRNVTSDAIVAQNVEIPELDIKQCGMLVKVDNLSYGGAHPATWASTNGVTDELQTTYNRFQDRSDNSIYVVCSGYAKFAHKQIPQGKVSVCGILEYGKTNTSNNVFILKIRGLDDVTQI